MLDPNVINPEVLEFLTGIMTEFLAKKGVDILDKSTDRIFNSLRKKFGKDELEKIKGLTTPEAKKRLEKLVKDKSLRKEVHTFYVIYKYLEKFTEDSQFLRVMDFRIGEGLPLERMYMKLRVVEEKKKKKEIGPGGFYGEDYYYTVKKMGEREEPSKKIDPDEIMDMDKGVFCILGLPGAGKTTLCKYFCWKTLKGEYVKQGLPIYVELRGVEKKEDPVTYAFYSKLKEHFTKEEIEEAIATIKHNTEIFSPLFIFDGLDEVKVDYGIISKSIKNCADSSVCVVTSRRSGFRYMGHDKTYEILPLEWEEKKEFVRNYFERINEEDKIDPFLQVLEKKGYNSLSKNPMLLSILCALASGEDDIGNLPSQKSGLYKQITVKMNEWHRSKGGEGLSHQEMRALEDLALRLFRKKRPKILFEKGFDETILDKAVTVGIVYKWDALRYSFLHLTLQEYFAACSLKALGREKWEGIIREKKDAVVWHEIIQLFVSILNEEDEELEILFSLILESPDMLCLNYALAGHCLAEIDMDDVDGSDEIFRQIMCEFEKNVCKFPFFDSFVHLREKAVDPLIDLLKETDDNNLKWRISDALGKLGDKAVDPLLDLLKETDDNNLKWRISFALGKIGDSKAVDPLIDLLKETDDDNLKENISYALGKLGDKAVDPLIDLLKETDDNYLRANISSALGGIGDKAVDPLIDLLKETDDNNLKGSISFALGGTGGSKAVDPLIDLLKETDDNSKREFISYDLGKLGDPKAVDPLIDLLKKTDDNDLKRSILDALSYIGDKAVDPLLDLLKETDDNDLKRSISFALGKIGDSKAVDPLLDLLKETDDNDLKRSISEALDKFGGSKAVDPLLDLLKKTDDNDLKRSISYALDKFGGSKAVDPLLDLLKKTDDNDLKRSISYALGEIGDPKAVDPLIDLLKKTDDNYLKRSISEALGKLGDPKAVDPLIDLLKKTDDNDLKWSISEALGKLGGSKAVDPLIDLLQKTDDNNLKWRISDALGKIGDKAVDPLIDLLKKTDDNNLKGNISYALGKIEDPKAVDPLIDLLKKTDDNDLNRSISYALKNFNPIHLYPFIENQLHQYVIHVLCHFSTEYNIRFFKDKIVLPEGEILYTGTERQREQSIKKLDKIIKL